MLPTKTCELIGMICFKYILIPLKSFVFLNFSNNTMSQVSSKFTHKCWWYCRPVMDDREWRCAHGLIEASDTLLAENLRHVICDCAYSAFYSRYCFLLIFLPIVLPVHIAICLWMGYIVACLVPYYICIVFLQGHVHQQHWLHASWQIYFPDNI